MRYKDINCEKCGAVFTEDDDVVVCPVCGAPHHRSCWNEANACAHESEHDTGYQWIMPEKPEEKAHEEQKKPLPNEFMLKNGESVIVCPRCGSMNCENDVYCMRCGAPLKENAQQNNGGEFFGEGAYTENQNYQQQNYQRERMAADFNRFGGIDPNAEIDGIPVAEYSDYVGGRTPGKIIRKIAVMLRFGKEVSWCWPAVFIGPVWFFWRKMKKEGVIFSALLIALCLFTGLLQINAPLERYYKDTFAAFEEVISGELTVAEFQEKLAEYSNIYAYAELTSEESAKATAASVLSYLAEPGISIACALTAMHFYRKKIKNSVLDIRTRCTSMDEYRAALQQEGGTSIGWGAVGAVLYIAARLCATYLPAILILTRR